MIILQSIMKLYVGNKYRNINTILEVLIQSIILKLFIKFISYNQHKIKLLS
jgi:hypothetical protein